MSQPLQLRCARTPRHWGTGEFRVSSLQKGLQHPQMGAICCPASVGPLRRGKGPKGAEEKSPGVPGTPPGSFFLRNKLDKFRRDALGTTEPLPPVFKNKKINKLTEKTFETYLGQETGQIARAANLD